MAGRRTVRQANKATSSGRLGTSSAFWDFSLRVYAQPQVAAACLGLQERHGLDVNLLLLGCWLGAHGPGHLGEVTWRDLCAQVAVWQAQVVAPLRQVRRRLKDMLPAGASHTTDPLASLRRAVADCELDSECLEQLMLERAVAMAPAEARVEGASDDAGAEAVDTQERGCTAVAANLHTYLAVTGVDAREEHRALSTLIAGVFPQVPMERIAALVGAE